MQVVVFMEHIDWFCIYNNYYKSKHLENNNNKNNNNNNNNIVKFSALKYVYINC